MMQEEKECFLHIDYAVSEDCKNPNSYGYICVKCGQCGREFVIKNTNKQDQKAEESE